MEHSLKPKKVKSKTSRRKAKPAKTKNDQWILSLYVAGQTPRTVTAVNNLKAICEEQLEGKYQIEVVDLLQNPQLGRDQQIVVTPTLVRKLPVPVRRIIGDLSNTERVLVGLDLKGQFQLKNKSKS